MSPGSSNNVEVSGGMGTGYMGGSTAVVCEKRCLAEYM